MSHTAHEQIARRDEWHVLGARDLQPELARRAAPRLHFHAIFVREHAPTDLFSR
jgi:hypothetical protein